MKNEANNEAGNEVSNQADDPAMEKVLAEWDEISKFFNLMSGSECQAMAGKWLPKACRAYAKSVLEGLSFTVSSAQARKSIQAEINRLDKGGQG